MRCQASCESDHVMTRLETIAPVVKSHAFPISGVTEPPRSYRTRRRKSYSPPKCSSNFPPGRRPVSCRGRNLRPTFQSDILEMRRRPRTARERGFDCCTYVECRGVCKTDPATDDDSCMTSDLGFLGFVEWNARSSCLSARVKEVLSSEGSQCGCCCCCCCFLG